MHFVKLHWDIPKHGLHFTNIILCSLFSCVSSCLINSKKKIHTTMTWTILSMKLHKTTQLQVNSFYQMSFYIGKLFQAYQKVSRFSKSYNNRSIKLLQKVCKFASIEKQEISLDSFMNIFVYLLNMPHYESSLIIQLGLFYLRRYSLKCNKFMSLKGEVAKVVIEIKIG